MERTLETLEELDVVNCPECNQPVSRKVWVYCPYCFKEKGKMINV